MYSPNKKPPYPNPKSKKEIYVELKELYKFLEHVRQNTLGSDYLDRLKLKEIEKKTVEKIKQLNKEFNLKTWD